MAQDDTTSVSTACFLWKTERPFRDVSRRSYEFSLLGVKWYLEAKCSLETNITYYTITLKKKTSTVPAKNYINVTTILNYSNAVGIADYKYQLFVHNTENTLCRYSEQILIEKNRNFLTNGVWKVICVFHDILPPELKIENVKVDSWTQIEEDTSPTAEKCTQVSRDFSDMEKLSDDFSNLLRLSLHPDAKLRCGDRTVSVHRSILAARSPVFNTKFRDENTDTYDVTELDDKVLDLLLEYVYTGTIHEMSDDTAVGMYGAGQKFAMDSLRKACSDWMVAHLTEENCVGFLDAASSSDDKPLEEAVSSFLRDHPNVFKSQSWIRFAEQQPSLAYKLIHIYAFHGV